jgi:hypothetical protein
MNSNWTVAIVGAAVFVLSIPPAAAWEEPDLIPPLTAAEPPLIVESGKALTEYVSPPASAHGTRFQIGRRRDGAGGMFGHGGIGGHHGIVGHHGTLGGHHGLLGSRLHAVAGHPTGAIAGAAHSGQPIIDPWLRADWIAQQRAATKSWHAGYYHTQWGGPVALMVPPTVRTQTRWGWGVAQTTVEPLYHQFKRPYPGPVGAAGPVAPLLPTPRWPSHTDQFGVYYVRGPW